MKLLVVDDEMIALRGMVRLLSGMYPDAQIISASGAQDAIAVFMTDIDVAFLDVELPGMTGIELGQKLLEKKKNLNIIYVTAYSEFALDAYKLHASGYLTKPVDENQIIREMENLRYELQQELPKLKIRCFGNFEIFLNGKPAHFSRSRAKEVFAYLVDRKGASVTLEELSEAFWGEESDLEKNKTNLQAMIKSLRKTLDENGMKDVLVCRRNSYAVDTAMVDCDYYRYLKGGGEEQKLFSGEYMSQYHWAKRTLEQMN